MLFIIDCSLSKTPEGHLASDCHFMSWLDLLRRRKRYANSLTSLTFSYHLPLPSTLPPSPSPFPFPPLPFLFRCHRAQPSSSRTGEGIRVGSTSVSDVPSPFSIFFLIFFSFFLLYTFGAPSPLTIAGAEVVVAPASPELQTSRPPDKRTIRPPGRQTNRPTDQRGLTHRSLATCRKNLP